METLLGIDIGTTGCKVGLFDNKGNLLRQSYRTNSIISKHPNEAEEDPKEWWANTVEAIQEIIKDDTVETREKRIAATSFS